MVHPRCAGIPRRDGHDVSFFSIKRTRTSDATEDFQIVLNGKSYAATGKLGRSKTKKFPISLLDLADQDRIIRLKASIKGNHYGLAQLIYRGPLLMGRNARFKVDAVDGKTFDISLTAKLSGFEQVFKTFPFSRKYGGVGVQTSEGNGEHHASTNKNQWITSDLATKLSRLRIASPT